MSSLDPVSKNGALQTWTSSQLLHPSPHLGGGAGDSSAGDLVDVVDCLLLELVTLHSKAHQPLVCTHPDEGPWPGCTYTGGIWDRRGCALRDCGWAQCPLTSGIYKKLLKNLTNACATPTLEA